MTRTGTAKTWIEVSRAALRHNAAVLRSVIGPKVRLMAVVKANAYGHGLPETVKALGRAVDWFGVDSLEEAEAVRAAGGRQPVLILGCVPGAALTHVVRQGFSIVVYDLASLRALDRLASARRPAKVHLKVETGTARQGVLLEDLSALAKAMKKFRHVVLEGLSTHYANIEDTTDPGFARRQLRLYEQALTILEAQGLRPSVRHTAASAAALIYPETRFDLVRAGLALYGMWPSKETRATMRERGAATGLRPALAWKAMVAQVKELPAGTPVSYGLTEKVTRSSRVAVVPVGYSDGYDRGLSSVGQVLIRGRRAKVLGRVCMNMTVVDVTDIPGARAGDEVVLLGRQGKETVTAEEIAGKIGTINYEIASRINPLIHRSLVS